MILGTALPQCRSWFSHKLKITCIQWNGHPKASHRKDPREGYQCLYRGLFQPHWFVKLLWLEQNWLWLHLGLGSLIKLIVPSNLRFWCSIFEPKRLAILITSELWQLLWNDDWVLTDAIVYWRGTDISCSSGSVKSFFTGCATANWNNSSKFGLKDTMQPS